LYEFLVHVRHPAYRLVVKADAPPPGTSQDEWRLTRRRDAADINAEVREAVDRDGYSLFRIGLSRLFRSDPWGTALAPGTQSAPPR
jgi:hypothetical protein